MVKKKSSKVKNGAWFVKVRGSYLPATPQGWLVHACLMACAATVIYASYYQDNRMMLLVLSSAALQLIGLGAVFTWIASKKA